MQRHTHIIHVTNISIRVLNPSHYDVHLVVKIFVREIEHLFVLCRCLQISTRIDTLAVKNVFDECGPVLLVINFSISPSTAVLGI